MDSFFLLFLFSQIPRSPSGVLRKLRTRYNILSAKRKTSLYIVVFLSTCICITAHVHECVGGIYTYRNFEKKKKTKKGPWSLSLHHFNCYTILAGLIINEGRISMIMMYTALSLEDKQGAVSLRFSKAIEDVVVVREGGCCVLSFLGCCCSSSARVLRVSLLKKTGRRSRAAL